MPLDPQVQDVLDAMIALGAPPLNTLPVADARAAFIALGAARRGEPEPVSKVEDRTIPGPEGVVPVRIYTPEGDGPFPVLVFSVGRG